MSKFKSKLEANLKIRKKEFHYHDNVHESNDDNRDGSEVGSVISGWANLSSTMSYNECSHALPRRIMFPNSSSSSMVGNYHRIPTLSFPLNTYSKSSSPLIPIISKTSSLSSYNRQAPIQAPIQSSIQPSIQPPIQPPKNVSNNKSNNRKDMDNPKLNPFYNCLHVRPGSARLGTLTITQKHLTFIYNDAKDQKLDDLPDYNHIQPISNLQQNDHHRRQIQNEIENQLTSKINAARFGKHCTERYQKRDYDQDDYDTIDNNNFDHNHNDSSSCSSSAQFSSSYHSDKTNDDYALDKNDRILISKIQEEAKIRLQEIDEAEIYNNNSIHGNDNQSYSDFDIHSNTSSLSIPSSKIMLANVTSETSPWEKQYLKSIEKKAKRYLKKLEYAEREYQYHLETNKDIQSDDESHISFNTQYDVPTSSQSTPNTKYKQKSYCLNETQDQKSKGFKWELSHLKEIYSRQYKMKYNAIEIFGHELDDSMYPNDLQGSKITSSQKINKKNKSKVPLGPLSHTSLYLVFPGIETINKKIVSKQKNQLQTFISIMQTNVPNLSFHYWYDETQHNLENMSSPNKKIKSATNTFKFTFSHSIFQKKDSLSILTRAWRKSLISNFDYLIRINAIAGRSMNDLGHYPIMPWVLSNYTSTSLPDLTKSRNFRQLDKPMGAQDEERKLRFLEKYNSLCANNHDDESSYVPPFMYGSHYSSSGGVVLHYLVRLQPFASLHKKLQVRFSSIFFFFIIFLDLIINYCFLALGR